MSTATNVEELQGIVNSLARQVMMQQLNTEETVRTLGDSGVAQMRVSNFGTRPWYVASHIKHAVNAIHDHAQNSRTVGMGEVSVFMNGVQFRTRHNDYQLAMPHRTSKNYHATEFIPYPDVPPEVLAKENTEDQITEMREWFKAFKDQDYSVRDYREYFKPVLCYLEGAWTQSSDEIEEPFESDRHHIDATTWWDLTEKIRFTSFSGTKSNQENYSFLPMKIINIDDKTGPVFAQWNYRILCAPLEEDLPTMYLRPINELQVRMRMNEGKQSMEDYEMTRRARFQLEKFTSSNIDKERICRYCLLDKLMAKIPGMDNYKGDLTDEAFGNIALHFEDKDTLNTAFYHRVYMSSKAGAMGTTRRNRGFADGNLFMAQTSQSKIPSMSVTDCPGKEECTTYTQRWSYAIPLEILYLTPLFHWNPHNINILSDNKDRKAWNAVDADGRNGGYDENTAYNGNRRNKFYHTPAEFFEGGSGDVDADAADTSGGTVGVLDQEGNVRNCSASATRIMLPEIPGVGIVRTRYPISPLYNEGSQIYKEVEALKDVVMRKDTYKHMVIE